MEPATKKEHPWSDNTTTPRWEDVPKMPQCTKESDTTPTESQREA